MQVNPNQTENWSEWILRKLRLPNPMQQEVPNQPLDYYTCPFKTSKIDRYAGGCLSIILLRHFGKRLANWDIIFLLPFHLI